MTGYGVRGGGLLRWTAWSAVSLFSLGCAGGSDHGETEQAGRGGNGFAGTSASHAGLGGASGGAVGGAGVGGAGGTGGLVTAGAGGATAGSTSGAAGRGGADGGSGTGGAPSGGAGSGTSGEGGRSGDGGVAGSPAGGAGQSGVGGASGTGGTSGAAGTGGDSPILAPDDGALLGFYYGDDSIAETATKLGRDVPIHLTYYAWTDDWTGSVTRQDLQNGRIPLVNWELYEGGDLAEIVAGDHDDMLAERAESAAALGKPFFLDLGAEMNGDWSPWSGAQNGESADLYLAMYRHVHDAFASASNVIWVWCPNVTDEPRASWNETLDYYPGDDYVDWTCVDGYNWGDTGGGGWQSFQEVFENVYPKLAGKNKPIMIGEMASAESGGDKAAFIAGMLPALRDDFPLIKALVWFDVNKETDWRVSSSPAAEAAFKTFANDPYMNP